MMNKKQSTYLYVILSYKTCNDLANEDFLLSISSFYHLRGGFLEDVYQWTLPDEKVSHLKGQFR